MHSHPPPFQFVPGVGIIQQLIKHCAGPTLAKLDHELPGLQEVMLGDLRVEVLPEPEVGGQKAKQLTRGVVGRCFIPMGKNNLLAKGMLVTIEHSI